VVQLFAQVGEVGHFHMEGYLAACLEMAVGADQNHVDLYQRVSFSMLNKNFMG
jgi:hypothetical protein